MYMDRNYGRYVNIRTVYTARQLCGITLLVPPFYLLAYGNICQSQYKAFVDPLTNFCGRPSLLSSPGQPSFSGELISPIAPKAVWRICVDHSQQSYPGATWASIEDNHTKRRPHPSMHLEAEVFSQLSRIRVELIRRTGRPVVVPMVQGRLVTAGYQSRYPDRCHRCRPRMLADMPQNWKHQHWSYPIFDDESRVSLYYSDQRACEFHLFLGYKNPLAFQQHDEKHGHAHYSYRGWLWIHQQIAHETSADYSSCGSCESNTRRLWRW